MKFQIFIEKIYIIVFLLCKQVLPQKLISSIIVLRHGDRGPVRIYPKDIYQINAWNNEWGKLTNQGIYDSYLLGEFIKNRYISNNYHLINSSFKYNDLFVRSTDVDRTLMTIETILAGLYPPAESFNHEQLWNKGLNWQPIPIHTIPINSDYLLNGGSSCKLFQKLENNLWENDEQSIQINNKYKDLFKYIQNQTGISNFNLKNFDDLADPLISELSQNLSQPIWLNETMINFILKLHSIKFIMNYKYKKMYQLAAGVLMDEIIQIFKVHKQLNKNVNVSSRIINKTLLPVLHIFSGHDTTISSALSLLDSFNLNPNITSPSFSSALFFELFHDKASKDDQYSVKLFYRNYPLIYFLNDTSQNNYSNVPGYIPKNYKFDRLNLPNCEEGKEYCPLSTFMSYVTPNIPKDIQKECDKDLYVTYCESTKSNWATCFLVLPIFSIILLVLISWGFYLCFFHKKSIVLILPSPNRSGSPDVPINYLDHGDTSIKIADDLNEENTDERTNLLHQK